MKWLSTGLLLAGMTFLLGGERVYAFGGAPSGGTTHQVNDFRAYSQKASNWCWIAVTQMIFQQQTHKKLSQCKMASRLVLNQPGEGCCGWGSDCNQPGILSSSLYGYGLIDPKAWGEVKASEDSKILSMVRDNRTLVSRIRWDDQAVGHVVLIHGITLKGSKTYLHVEDPYWGESILQRKDLERYQDVGTWDLTYWPSVFQGDINDFLGDI